MNDHVLVSLLNLVLNLVVFYVCMCRVTVMTAATTRVFTRLAYTGLAVAAIVSGCWYWLVGDYSNWNDVLSSAALLAFMLSGARAWKDGLPAFAKHPSPN